MAALKLVIGNKNYSSWSMRPWLALRANDIAFDEVFIPLYTGEVDKKRILSFTRAGKVPALPKAKNLGNFVRPFGVSIVSSCGNSTCEEGGCRRSSRC